ncbi:MAG: flavodoxin family protein [Firmicutes bacterium]|nr:flavodoxin family protein [Bacillota bacterium]MBQ4467036.1 flavodoxin family protein [Bacillota bacterium]MCR4709083.1 flavodoxin family protein [Clostridiales bacterium]
MNILVLNGSPRANSNTKAHCEAFMEGARAKGHEVEMIDIAKMKITGCLGCEYCHAKGEGKCVQQDDMQKIYPVLTQWAEMIVIASPIYYWGFSGHMMSLITRFYAIGKPAATKYAMFLSSGSPGVYDAPISEYKSILRFFGATNMGIITANGDENKSEAKLKELRDFGLSL